MLLAGDIFDGPATRETVELVKRSLKACGVPVLVAPGNHDCCAPGSPWVEEGWPENVTVFTGPLTSVVIGSLDCRVYGAGFSSMDCPSLLEGFRAERTTASKSSPPWRYSVNSTATARVPSAGRW